MYVSLPSGPFVSEFPTKILCVFLSSHIRATGPPHLNLVNLIFHMLFAEDLKSNKYTLCYFLANPFTSPLQISVTFLEPNSRKPPAYILALIWETKFYSHTKLQTKLYVCILCEGKLKAFIPKRSRHSPNLIYSLITLCPTIMCFIAK